MKDELGGNVAVLRPKTYSNLTTMKAKNKKHKKVS